MNPQLRRAILDLGPLIVFFAAIKFWGFLVATAIFMVLILGTVALGYALERRLSPMPLFTAAVVLVFGGLTLYFKDPRIFKLKVTFVYCTFGVMLLAGLFFNRLFIKYVFSEAFDLDEQGWRKLTLRWGIFFLALAGLNEIIWRNVTDPVWALSKIGFVVLIFLFTMTQVPLILRHTRNVEEKAPD